MSLLWRQRPWRRIVPSVASLIEWVGFEFEGRGRRLYGDSWTTLRLAHLDALV